MIQGRLGVVPYLNAKPLQFGLRERLPTDALVEAPPSALARMLEADQLLAALVSSFACFANVKPLRVLPGICIASNGPVQSVKLFLRRPMAEVERIGLHTASLSSAALARIVVRERFDRDPDFVPFEPGQASPETDAHLLIGDAAMTTQEPPVTIDLGEEWQALTGLPFVYALWGVRETADDDELRALLLEAKQRGIEHVDAIAEAESARLGLEENLCRRYLREAIHYDLGEREVQGLALFLDKCKRHDLVPGEAKIELLP